MTDTQQTNRADGLMWKCRCGGWSHVDHPQCDHCGYERRGDAGRDYGSRPAVCPRAKGEGS